MKLRPLDGLQVAAGQLGGGNRLCREVDPVGVAALGAAQRDRSDHRGRRMLHFQMHHLSFLLLCFLSVRATWSGRIKWIISQIGQHEAGKMRREENSVRLAALVSEATDP